MFTDINPDYLDRLEARLEEHELAFDTAVDDIENSSLAGGFDLAIAVLVLEHVDWRRAVASLCRLALRVFVVIQEDPPDLEPMPVVGTMNLLRELHAGLVDARKLASEFECYGFRLQSTRSREVAHAKKMVGMEFISRTLPI